MLNQYPIVDITEWMESGVLRGDTPFDSCCNLPEPIRNRLLTTIIDQELIPPVYIGITSNPATMKTIRTVYRGASLIRALNDFTKNRTFIHGPFGSVSFNTLPRNTQHKFLAYQVPVFEISGVSKQGVQRMIEQVDLLSSTPY